MTSDNRFRPPEAALGPRARVGEFSRGPVMALGLMGLLQVVSLAVRLPVFYRLVSEGAMNPVGPFICLVGCVCLYAGLLRALPNGARGRNLFLAAVVLLLSGLTMLDAHRAFFRLWSLMPFVLAFVIAVLGLALTWTRSRARKEPA